MKKLLSIMTLLALVNLACAIHDGNAVLVLAHIACIGIFAQALGQKARENFCYLWAGIGFGVLAGIFFFWMLPYMTGVQEIEKPVTLEQVDKILREINRDLDRNQK